MTALDWIQLFLSVVMGIALIVLFVALIRHFWMGVHVLDELQHVALQSLADEQQASLQAELSCSITKAPFLKQAAACFAGATDTALLLVVLDMLMAPVAEVSVPFAQITRCRIKPSILPHQYTIALTVGGKPIHLRLSCAASKKFPRHEANARRLLQILSRTGEASVDTRQS